MKQLRLFLVRFLIPTEPKARKKFFKTLMPGSHLHLNPRYSDKDFNKDKSI